MVKKMPEENYIEIKNLIKIYKRGKIEVQALSGISCSFQKGKIYVMMGPSGCGKTTLLNIIGGISKPTAGNIIVKNMGDISTFSQQKRTEFRREKIAYVFQNNNLIQNLTLWENVLFPYEILKNIDENKIIQINEILDFVNLANRKDHFPNELSGGEQQRTCLAAALVKDVDIILCDEPTGELDSKSKQQIMILLSKIIKEFSKKIIIVVSHDPEFKKIADKFLYIRDGKISHELSKDELKEFQNELNFEQKPQTNEDVLIELMEMKHILTKKIEKIKKQTK